MKKNLTPLKLNGNWSFFYSDRKKYIERNRKIREKNYLSDLWVMYVGSLIILLILSTNLFYDNDIIHLLIMVGCLTVATIVSKLLIPRIFIMIIRKEMKMIEDNPSIITIAGLKYNNQNKIQEAIRTFLVEHHKDFIEKKENPSTSHYDNSYEYKYVFDNENYVSISYNEGYKGKIYPNVVIGYSGNNYLEAVTLRRDLDRFLAGEDLFP